MERVSLPENKIEYDDVLFSEGVGSLFESVYLLWDAGASETEIRDTFEDALGNLS